MEDVFSLDPTKLPCHIGIIMDGNGRWASQRGLQRTAGHKEGLNAAKRVVKAASELGIPYLTLYTFSTENWNRTKEEVAFLMNLISQHLRKEYNFYRKNKVRVIHSGDLLNLPKNVQREILAVTKDTSRFSGLTVNLAINYGGKNEITRSVNRWLAQKEENGKSLSLIDEEIIEKYLDCPEMPEADYIIRTGGEYRLSNFLIWESAYAELYFDQKMWPDWGKADLRTALAAYQKRNRRFGGTPCLH